MTARKFLNRLGGFTLVELLIVIAILGVIALIVIAAINPIEQANRARDTGMKSDASQLLSAMDRYFAVKNDFPWVTQDSTTYNNDDDFGFMTASDYHIGLCDQTSGCTVDGILIDEQELKPEFRNRRFIDAAADSNYQDYLMIGKADQDQSVYICYVPLSKSNRQKACDAGEVYTLNNTGVKTTLATCPGTGPTSWTSTSDPLSQAYVCIPE